MSRLEWNNVSVTIPARGKTPEKTLLHSVNGYVQQGEMLAIMGPSGGGKTTLLNLLADRNRPARSNAHAEIYIDGRPCTAADVQKKSRLVEANDTLIGSLTVQETLKFAADLMMPAASTELERHDRVRELLQAFGLVKEANTIVGTLVQSGISTGQKRRLSVASMVMSAPQILFLDEPTSGLDSAASQRVISYIRNVARSHNLIVVCSIHQPSPTTLEQFGKLMLLSEGKMCYFGDTDAAKDYFERIGYPLPLYMNLADFILDLVNVDFEHGSEDLRERLDKIHSSYTAISANSGPFFSSTQSSATDEEKGLVIVRQGSPPNPERSGVKTLITLLHRSWLKSRRDVLVYGIRFGMYLGLAVMMGTVWLRLAPVQTNIQAYTNCILFGSAFMSFMAVVYVPAFVEDRRVYVKDRANGLYGSTLFFLSNFIIGLPYLFVIAAASSLPTYWLVNFQPTATAFFFWIMWMYLNLVAAESLVVLIASLFPNFVGALALTAMVNGIWMACNGFMVTPPALNVFWRYVFYYINYQAYVFRGLVVNEFSDRDYSCNGGCYCMIDTPLNDRCEIMGTGVLKMYGFTAGPQGKWVGITVAIIVGLRLLGWAALEWRR